MQPRCISASPGKRGLGARQFACGVEVIRPLTFCFSSLPTHQLQPLPPPLRLLTDLRGCIGTFVSMFNLMLSALAWSHWKRICTLAAVPACPSGTAPSRLSPCTRSTPSRARSRGRGPEAPDAVTSGGWHPLAPRSQGSAKDRQPPLSTQGAVVHVHKHVDGIPRLWAESLVLHPQPQLAQSLAHFLLCR